MPTMGRFEVLAPMEPKKGSQKENTPPSDAAKR